MNIGILQSAGIAGTVIECALSTPDNDDVFTATIYSKDNGNDKNVGADLKSVTFRALSSLLALLRSSVLTVR